MHHATVRRFSEAEVPTRAGVLRLVVYREGEPESWAADGGREHVAIVAGDPAGDEVMARVHSECWTGEVLFSEKCDCREQLDAAVETIRFSVMACGSFKGRSAVRHRTCAGCRGGLPSRCG